MRATGIYNTNCFSRKADDQRWEGENDCEFLGGFGSDYCSGNIDDRERIYKDRGIYIFIFILLLLLLFYYYYYYYYYYLLLLLLSLLLLLLYIIIIEHEKLASVAK